MRAAIFRHAFLLLSLALSAAQAVEPAPADKGPVFDILEFDISGNTVLANHVIENAVYPYLGLERGVLDVEKARAALERSYHENGYLSVEVKIPEQPVTEGLIRLQVYEGSVERLKVSGNKYSSRSTLRAEVPSLAAGSVPHYPTMQEELGELGRMSDRRVAPLLRPGQFPGKMEVELAVEEELPFHGSLELNNKQSPDTSKQRLEASLRYDNLFQRGHSASLFYITAPEKSNEVDVLLAGYRVPLGLGRSLSAYWLSADSNIATAGDSTVIGNGSLLGMRLGLPLLTPTGLGKTFFHSLSLGFDSKDFRERQTVLSTDQKTSPLRYTPLVGQYSFGYFGSAGEWLGNLTVTAGMRGSSQRQVECYPGIQIEQFSCRRAGAKPNFITLRGDLTYTYRIVGWELLARGDFQAAGQPLVSNEQFVAGGIDSVRGYFEGETAGDMGWRLRGEIKTPSLLGNESTNLRALTFVDAAGLRLVDPLPGQQDTWSLSSVGLGVRVKAPKGLQLSIDWARALSNGANSLNGYRTASGSDRIHVRLGTSF